MADKKLTGDYKQTKTYREADKQTKKNYEAWRKDQNITSEHMYLLMYRQDYRNLPADEKRKANSMAEMMVISGIVIFLVATASEDKYLLLIASVYTLVSAVLYFTGVFSPVQRELNKANKQLKAYPKVKSFEEFMGIDKSEEED